MRLSRYFLSNLNNANINGNDDVILIFAKCWTILDEKFEQNQT